MDCTSVHAGPINSGVTFPFTVPSTHGSCHKTYGIYRQVPAPTSFIDLYKQTTSGDNSVQLTLISLRLFGFFTRRK